jgi:hypothetical protein
MCYTTRGSTLSSFKFIMDDCRVYSDQVQTPLKLAVLLIDHLKPLIDKETQTFALENE